MRTVPLILVFALLAAGARAQESAIEAITASGERVRLFASGRWEYADEKRAQAQRQARVTEEARERSAQGGLLGIGRRVYEGDKDYNRGSLNPKLR